MKYWRGQFWALTMFLVAGGILPSASFQTQQPAVEKIFSIAVPEAGLDFSDLDLRDADNKPIADVRAQQAMRALFAKSLTQALLLNLTPAKRALYDVLAQGRDVLSNRLRRAAQAVVDCAAALLAKIEHRPLPHCWRFVKPADVFEYVRSVFSIPSSHALRLLASVQLLR